MMRRRLWQNPDGSCVCIFCDAGLSSLRRPLQRRPYSRDQPPPSFPISPLNHFNVQTPARGANGGSQSSPGPSAGTWGQFAAATPPRASLPDSLPPLRHGQSGQTLRLPPQDAVNRGTTSQDTRATESWKTDGFIRSFPPQIAASPRLGRITPATNTPESHAWSASTSRSSVELPPRPPPLETAASGTANGRQQRLAGMDMRRGWVPHKARRDSLLHRKGPSQPEWEQLVRRVPAPSHLEDRAAPDIGQGQPGLLGQLAKNVAGARKQPVLDPSGSQNFWSNVKDRLADLENTPPNPSDNKSFMDQFKGRVLDKKTYQGKHTKDSRNWDWVEEEKKEKQKMTSVEELPSSRVEAPPLVVPDRVERDRDRDRGRLDRFEKPKTKPKLRRRSYGEEDDDYDAEEAAERAEERRRRKEQKKREKLAAQKTGPTPIFLPELISVSNLSTALGVKLDLFLSQLYELGFEDINQGSIMSGETAALVAQEYGFEPTVDMGESVDLKPRPTPEDPSTLPPRPPIVTIMGHVDHGKTTMLDWLRKSSVAAQEHGGITQHIGAFSVKLSTGKHITFLDTPGHAAFLTMRQRGANVTDIVILVVAADDSVKPQTLEALKHARAAKVPIIVAINKVDKDEARIDHVKADLARHGIEIEDFGGDVQVVCVSGKTGQGMDDLEENILTLAEILDMRAESEGMAEGWVLESSVKPTGKVATVLVKRGTLRKGDIIVAGSTWARIRVLRNEAGIEIEEAPPGTPVEVLGWKDPPDAGDQVLQAPDEGKAKDAAHYREEMKAREKIASEMAVQERKEREKAALEASQNDESAPVEQEEESGTKTANFIVKGDVMGSVEAVCAAVMEIGNNEVQPRILRSSPGQITESDVDHAAASNSSIINFNNPIPGMIKLMAEDAGIAILDHTVIYHLVDDVKDNLSKQLAPTISSRVLGEAEILQVFPINLKGRIYKNIAGCRVRNGQMTRSAKYRVLRKGEKIFDGKLESLKQGKRDVAEMKKGTECGIAFDEWQGFQVGDQIQAYEEIKEQRHL